MVFCLHGLHQPNLSHESWGKEEGQASFLRSGKRNKALAGEMTGQVKALGSQACLPELDPQESHHGRESVLKSCPLISTSVLWWGHIPAR